MDRIIPLVDRVFSYYHWRRSRANHLVAIGKRPTRFGKTPDMPLNSVESCVLFFARVLLERLRKCVLCCGGRDQEDFINFDGFPVHVSCGAEHNDAMMVDPTAMHLGESDGGYKSRMRRDFPEF